MKETNFDVTTHEYWEYERDSKRTYLTMKLSTVIKFVSDFKGVC